MSDLCPVAVPLEYLNEPQAKTSSEAFLSFLQNKQLCDVTFVFENQPDKIEAHQLCLRARSPVFNSMFQGLERGTDMKEVKIDDASPEIVNKFLQFIYADKFDVTTASQALHLLHMGLKYKVQPLVDQCEAFIDKGISTEHALEIYEAAEKYQLMDLMEKAGGIIASSLEDFLQDPKLMKVKDTTLVALLQRDEIEVAEVDLFKLALKWGQNNSSGDQELAVALTEILPHICFTDMSPEQFTTVVWPTKLIPLEETAKIYAYITGDDSTKAAILPSLNSITSGPKVVDPEFTLKYRQFLYADKFDVTTAQALRLLNSGYYFKQQKLVNRCEAFIGERLTIENAIEMYEVAEKYKLTELRTKAGHVIARSFEHFLEDPKLMKAKKSTLISLLKRSDLTVMTETDLVRLALQWGQANSNGDDDLAVTLTGTLLPFIRFTNMTPQEFTNVVWPTKLLKLLSAEDINKIYAYMNGDDSTRNAILPLLTYETLRRNVKKQSKFQDNVTFTSDRNWLLAKLGKVKGCSPFTKFMSFITAVVGLWEEGKTSRIPSVTKGLPIHRLFQDAFIVFLPLALLLMLLTVFGDFLKLLY